MGILGKVILKTNWADLKNFFHNFVVKKKSVSNVQLTERYYFGFLRQTSIKTHIAFWIGFGAFRNHTVLLNSPRGAPRPPERLCLQLEEGGGAGEDGRADVVLGAEADWNKERKLRWMLDSMK